MLENFRHRKSDYPSTKVCRVEYYLTIALAALAPSKVVRFSAVRATPFTVQFSRTMLDVFVASSLNPVSNSQLTNVDGA